MFLHLCFLFVKKKEFVHPFHPYFNVPDSGFNVIFNVIFTFAVSRIKLEKPLCETPQGPREEVGYKCK